MGSHGHHLRSLLPCLCQKDPQKQSVNQKGGGISYCPQLWSLRIQVDEWASVQQMCADVELALITAPCWQCPLLLNTVLSRACECFLWGLINKLPWKMAATPPPRPVPGGILLEYYCEWGRVDTFKLTCSSSRFPSYRALSDMILSKHIYGIGDKKSNLALSPLAYRWFHIS